MKEDLLKTSITLEDIKGLQRKPHIMILGWAGGGKSGGVAGLNRLVTDIGLKVVVLGSDQKGTPPNLKQEYKFFQIQCPTTVPEVIREAAVKYDVIVLDSLTNIMEDYNAMFQAGSIPQYVYELDEGGEEGDLISNVNYIPVNDEGRVSGLQAWGTYKALVKNILRSLHMSGKCTFLLGHPLQIVDKVSNKTCYTFDLQGASKNRHVERDTDLLFMASKVTKEDLVHNLDYIDMKSESALSYRKHAIRVAEIEDDGLPTREVAGLFPDDVLYAANDYGMLLEQYVKLVQGKNT